MKGNTIVALHSPTLLPESIIWPQQKSLDLGMSHMWSADHSPSPKILVFAFQNDVFAKTLWSLPMDLKSVLLAMDKEEDRWRT